MAWNIDARVPVLALPDIAALAAALRGSGPAALLLATPAPPDLPAGGVARESFPADAPHVPACDCCGGRPAAATALDRLFQRRLRGTAPWFDRVLALLEGEEARDALRSALRDDAVTRARFRAG